MLPDEPKIASLQACWPV